MTKKNQTDSCCQPEGKEASCCRIESVISIDERGQMVLPKEIRDRGNINPGDKFAVISWEKEGAICCISLIRVEELSDMVKNMLGPLMTGVIQK